MLRETLEHPRDGAPMVLVPAGPFLMGLPDGDLLAEEHERPQRRVGLPAFWIDIHPVTNARFALFLAAGGYEDSRWWSADGWAWRAEKGITRPACWGESGWDAPEQPAAGVSWYEADAYARWAGRRLPTDAEWEKAARGTDGRRYPWGDDWPHGGVANFDLAVGRTSPVGLFPEGASPYGCQDMAGNVNNWVRDWYWPRFGRWCVDHGLLSSPCLDDALRERLGAEEITHKVDRGGGFATDHLYHEVLGCTRKVHAPPTTREPWNGFRTALDGPGLPGRSDLP
jgi:formylglycine-generating enzyme required for sulfatase activity